MDGPPDILASHWTVIAPVMLLNVRTVPILATVDEPEMAVRIFFSNVSSHAGPFDNKVATVTWPEALTAKVAKWVLQPVTTREFASMVIQTFPEKDWVPILVTPYSPSKVVCIRIEIPQWQRKGAPMSKQRMLKESFAS